MSAFVFDLELDFVCMRVHIVYGVEPAWCFLREVSLYIAITVMVVVFIVAAAVCSSVLS